MTIKELLEGYNAKGDAKHERKVGRYYASEIGSIKNGWLTPKNFFAKPKFGLLSLQRMFTGKLFELGYKMLLEANEVEFEYEPKKEMDLGGFTLVVKPDFIVKGVIHECKLCFTSGAMERYQYQLEAEARAFALPVKMIKFSVPFGAEAVDFRPDDKRWQEIQVMLKDFDSKLKVVIRT